MHKTDAWTAFWQKGSLTSFGDRFSKGYQGQVRELWRSFFATLPRGAVIVDLGAGNGALEEIAEEVAKERELAFEMHAFDLAARLPARYKGKGAESAFALHWHAGVANENTGLPVASVDAITGSFAFEYGDEAATIAELARILKPAGCCQFLMHCSGSTLLLNGADELGVLEEQLKKDGFLDRVKEFLIAAGGLKKPGAFDKLRRSGKLEPLRIRINEAHDAAVRKATRETSVLLLETIMRWVGPLVTLPMILEPKKILLERLKEVRVELSANKARLLDMQRAEVDADRMQRILGLFKEAHMRPAAEHYFVDDSEVPVGWLVTASR